MKPIQEGSSIHWKTPPEILEAFEEEFGELFDPCPANPTFDGLDISWPMDKAAFVNPPYARGLLKKWVEKCFYEWGRRDQTIILLIPPYTDTAYFHDFILPWCEIRFIRGRLKFQNGKRGRPSAAPFPSMICIYPGTQDSEFQDNEYYIRRRWGSDIERRVVREA